VINLAGESGAVKSVRDALIDQEVNVGGHLAVLETLRGRRSPVRVVFISSRLVYGVTGSVSVSETHSLRPTSLYGLHKLTVEHYHRLYWEHFGIPHVTLRLTNPYGAFQLPDRREHGIVNRFILAALRGETITLFGGGRQLRDCVHVSDACAAILRAATDEQATGETLNIGAGVSVSLRGMAERIVDFAGSGKVKVGPWPAGFELVETGDFLCNTGRSARILGWKPALDLETGLRKAVEDYREILADAVHLAPVGEAR
jgi:nucleoside-diphosphate-sugar epimerase